jgi:glycosyltransferase involved in cell wall biosynthesis
MDWMALPRQSAIETRKPVLNLIQGLGHADSQSNLFQSLDRKAVRICVSEAVAEAILKTRRCNGPVFTIPNALAPDVSRQQSVEKTVRVAIVAAKQPDLATQIADTLRPLGIDVDLIEAYNRSTFRHRLARSEIAVFLPFEREGFYLPALEGMGLGCVVVCPDCVGSRSYCRAGVNSIVPAYSAADIVEATIAATRISAPARRSMLAAARDTAETHSERQIEERLVPLLNGML